MKFVLLNINSAKEKWSEEVVSLYTKKISHFIDFEIRTIKTDNIGREQKDVRILKETEAILKFLKDDDFIISFDERGTAFNSLDFSKKINNILNTGKKRVVFIIGGAYGLAEEIKKKSQLQISLSTLVFNHLIAEAVVLEQIYRAFTIIKNIPYHNV